MKLLYLTFLLIPIKSAYGIFQMIEPHWGQEVKENIKVRIVANEVSKNSFVGFRTNQKKLFILNPTLKNKYLEYNLDVKKIGLPQGKVILEAVLHTSVGKKTYEKTSHKALVNIKSEWKPKQEKIEYRFPTGDQWVYQYRSYIRPEGPELNTLEPDIKGKITFSFSNKRKKNVWVESRFFPEDINEKNVKIRNHEDPSKTIVFPLEKILSFWAQYDSKGTSSLERFSPLEYLKEDGLKESYNKNIGFLITYFPVVPDQYLQKNLKTEVLVSEMKLIEDQWKISQKKTEWQALSFDWLKSHRIVRFQYGEDHCKTEVCWDISLGRPLFWKVSKKIEISETIKEGEEEKKGNPKTYKSTEIFELEK